MPLDVDAMAKKKEKRSSNAGWRPKEGPNDVRVLPPTKKYFDDDVYLDYFARTFYIHYFRQEGYNTEVTRCLRDRDEYCPACEVSAKYDESDDVKLSEMADDVSRTQRHVMNILDMENVEDGIQTYTCGYTVHNEILEYAANPKWGDIFHPAEGHNVTIKLTPASKSRSGYNSYSVQPDPQLTDITAALPDDWKEQLDRLKHAVPEYKSQDQILRILERMGFPVQTEDEADHGSSGSSDTVSAPSEGTITEGESEEEPEVKTFEPKVVGSEDGDEDEESG